ncbi:hypothetical protein FIE12Z_4966 [Fusarium flagelliforme]|uniref:BTB domain-containing protein n=1 Tax=Fusarium flagelliforme TaxID=2675880 RepID=A0A395MRY0_9HYPO|nr:hypothetical protein FIE12Z_4966 [Fusarium flagelliforme]
MYDQFHLHHNPVCCTIRKLHWSDVSARKASGLSATIVGKELRLTIRISTLLAELYGNDKSNRVAANIKLLTRKPRYFHRLLSYFKPCMEDPITLRCDDSDTESFRLERQQVRSASRYLSRIFAKKRTRTVLVLKTRCEVLGLFCKWARDPTAFDNPSEGEYMQEPWLSNAAAAWILGQGIEAKEFQRLCLTVFINNCALAPFGPWKEIEERANDNAPLMRFSNHWVAWIFSTVQGVPQEFEGLRAVTRAKDLTRHIEDPRGFDQDHWYSTCGDQISPHCPHHPKAKEKRTDEVKPRRKVSTIDARERNPEGKKGTRQTTKPKKSHQSRLDSRNSLYINFQRSGSRSTRSHQSSRHSGQSCFSHEYAPSWNSDWDHCRESRLCRWASSVSCLRNTRASH